MFDVDDVKKRVGQKIKLVLKNKNYYQGVVESVGERTFFITDVTGKNVEISLNEVSEIVEVDS